MNFNPRTKKNGLGVVLLSVAMMLGVYIGRGTLSFEVHQSAEDYKNSAEEKDEGKILYWYDPMFPQQRFEKPGPSPFMDMALVPRYAEGEGDTVSGVQIDPAMIQNLGVRTAKVESVNATSQLTLTGQVTFNERAVTRMQSRNAAFVERVWPLAQGDAVAEGQPLARLRVPEWISAQHELVSLVQSGDELLVSAGRERARSLGMPDEVIRSAEETGNVSMSWLLRAPHAGIVQALNVREGMTLSAGAALLEINEFDTVWVDIAVPQTQIARVAVGENVDVQLEGSEPMLRHGIVAEILPLLDRKSRTVTARVELDNSNGDLRPGLSARVNLRGDRSAAELAVPTEALLRTGLRTVVVLRESSGRFLPVEVLPGQEIKNKTIIKEGLEEGVDIVVSGQFLLDSEASLRGVEVIALPPQYDKNSLHFSTGVVNAIGDGTVTLTHGPFESLSMDAMTMRFSIDAEVRVDGIQVGDRVRVGLREHEAEYIVEVLEKSHIVHGEGQ